MTRKLKQRGHNNIHANMHFNNKVDRNNISNQYLFELETMQSTEFPSYSDCVTDCMHLDMTRRMISVKQVIGFYGFSDIGDKET